MRYEVSAELNRRAAEIVAALGYGHIDMERVVCVKSEGSKTRRTVARIHGMGKVFQLAMNTKPWYVIEFLSEKFDKLSPEDQAKTILHELMHIPHSFGGGFRHHKPHVSAQAVEGEYRRYLAAAGTLP